MMPANAPEVPVSATHEVKSTCCYCGVGCGVLIESDGSRIIGVRGDPDHPANRGKLCSKGSILHLTARQELQSLRALYPEVRTDRSAGDNHSNQSRVRSTWDQALDHAADRFADIIRMHGPDAVAFYVSGQLLTEDYFVFNKLAKGLIGTNNIDTNSRLCMSSAVAAYKQSLGADAPPCAYEDIDLADVVFIAGANPAFAHPILYRRLEAARVARPNMKVIVVDPRRTDSAREADLHLAIQPGTDVALFNGMLHLLLWEELTDTDFIERHTEGFSALKTLVRDATPRAVAEICGIAESDLVTAAQWFGRSKATLSLYCQGLNQSTSGTAKNTALINLHLATGQIGRPGAGPFSLTGQPNAMGGREVGGLANQLCAHRDLADPANRAEVARLWGIEEVSALPGKTAVELFESLDQGSIKAVWIANTNPAQSLPDQNAVHRALRNAEFVVLQDAYLNTETAQFADVLLPATSWGEKEGTVTNSERRITRIHAAVDGPGETRADWEIAAEFARRLESRLRPGKPSLFPYQNAESVWNDHRTMTRGRDLDIGGLSYALLESRGPQQWPMPEGAAQGLTRLYGDGQFPTTNGRARFIAKAYRPPAEKTDARYPIALTTGRLRDQWHSMSRTGSVPRAFGQVAEPEIAMQSRDIARRGLTCGDLVEVQSRRGSIVLTLRASDEIASGQAYLPMHWGARFLGGMHSRGINTLTNPANDPDSKQPELKHAAVRIQAAQLPWRLVAFAFTAPNESTQPESCPIPALALIDQLAVRMREMPFASAVPIGRDREGVLLRLAAEQPPAQEWLGSLDTLFGLAHDGVARYDDLRLGVARRVDIRNGRLQGVRLSGPAKTLQGEAWLLECLLGERPVASIRHHLLAPNAQPPEDLKPRSPIVCSCFDVDERRIREALLHQRVTTPDQTALSSLESTLKCGTNCGSCRPRLKQLIAECLSSDTA